MSKAKLLIPLGIFITIPVLVLMCIFVNQFMSKGCLWWTCAPARSFDVLDLGLPSNLFPDNAEYQPIEASYSDNTIPVIKSGVQTIEWEHGDVRYSVTRYPNIPKSLDAYNNSKERLLSTWGGVINPCGLLLI